MNIGKYLQLYVLILVFVEVRLGGEVEVLGAIAEDVLILVFVEVRLGVAENLKKGIELKSLNPCFCGS